MNRFLRSFKFAFNGLKLTWSKGLNFKIQCFAAIITCVFAFYLKLDYQSIAILLITSALVMGLEIINTSIEDICNIISPEENPQIGHVKDISAAAVLLASIIAIFIGMLIFLPKLLLLAN